MKSVLQSWKLAYVITVLCKSSLVSDIEFDLNQIKGKVVVMKKVVVPAFQTLIVKGLLKVTRHQKCVHVLVEPSPKCKNIFILGNTTKMKPGGSRVDVVVQNLSGRELILEMYTDVGMISPGNKVPSVLTPFVLEKNVQDDENNESVECQSAQAELSTYEVKQTELNPEAIMEKIEMSGITDWNSTNQQEAYNMIHEYTCSFSWNDLDPGKTSIIKHFIKLTDPTPFKEYYRCIPPGMYDEVKAHRQEMLDIGAIHPSNSPQASAVVLV